MLKSESSLVNASYGEMQTTPLQKAIANNFVEMVGVLIRFGADIDLPSFSGWRPLHFAISAVFSSGASPNIIKI